MSKFPLLVCLLFLAAACSNGHQTPSGDQTSSAPADPSADSNPVAGQPEITITPMVKAGYEKYLSWSDPLAFAVSADGQHYGYYYCSYTCNVKLEKAEAEAISECGGNEGTQRKCAIFAVGRKEPRKYKLVTATSKGNSIILSDQDEVVLTPEVAQQYQSCASKMNPLAFAVSSDGKVGYCVYCTEMMCLRPSQYATEAVTGCNDRYAAELGTNDGHCVVFQIGRGEPRKYKVASQ
jgi:hypothetical protein